ncbi:hypothetical protein [Longimicrobium sp.]|uniref:hypothetical protein n=1 Tax=Longimicrobium sp. TaxID=2029185 RepID=UPI003B3B9CFD
MKLSSRAACALLALLAAAAPARAAAQEAEAWVLPRGLLEISATGSYAGWDTRLDGMPFGAELIGPYQTLANRLLGGQAEPVQAALTDLFANTIDPDSASDPLSLSPGALSLRFGGDVRSVPFNVRYGLTDRLTVFAVLPLERSGTVVFGPYFTGATLGLNPDTTVNRRVLAELDPRYAELGRGLLLPTRGSADGIELQSRLRAREDGGGDTLLLPARPLNFDDILARPDLRAQLSETEAAALGIVSTRRPYHLGDIQLGARFLLIPGPPGWPHPDTIIRRSLRTSLGVRLRLPTGSGDTRLPTEVPPGGGHLGLGVDVLNDVFLTQRWYVNVSASGDWMLPADVQRQPFTLAQPFPVDTTLTTARRSPGPRVAFSVTPRWRLTDEISFHGEYAMLAQARTRYEAGDSLLPSPFDWRTGGAMHALGLGMRYSSLQAFARGRARVPFELTLSASEAVLGTLQAPDAFSVRLTGRIFMDPRRVRALLPGRGTDSIIPPPDAPLDTVPSQVRPDSVPAAEPPVQPAPRPVVTEPPATPPAPPPTPPATSPATGGRIGRGDAETRTGSNRPRLGAVRGQEKIGITRSQRSQRSFLVPFPLISCFEAIFPGVG